MRVHHVCCGVKDVVADIGTFVLLGFSRPYIVPAPAIENKWGAFLSSDWWMYRDY